MRFFTAAITFTGLLLSAEAATITEDARCGPYGKGQTCLNSIWGSCCSQYGWCGSIDAYCGKGCQPGFGTCKSTTQPVSKDARCGTRFDEQTCLGSKFGDCCSKFFWCGVTNDHCRPSSCQKGYGRCGAISSSIRSNVASSVRSSAAHASTIKSSTTTVRTSSLLGASVTMHPENSLRSHSSSSAHSAISVHTSYLSVPSSSSTLPSHSSSSSELLSTPSFDGASLPASSSISELTYKSSSTYSEALVSTVIESSSTATSSFTPPSIKPISHDGRCGARFGEQTCQGKPDYPCCSTDNWCGIGSAWCKPENCQKEYGQCDNI